jgi:hypothetical protein
MMTSTQPPVTEADVHRELAYWLSQMPPDQLLDIIGDHLDTMSRTSNAHRAQRWELQHMGKGVKSIAGLAFSRRNR